MVWILRFVFLMFGYGVVQSEDLTDSPLRNYLISVVETLLPEHKEHFNVSEDFVVELGISMEEYLAGHNYTYEKQIIVTRDDYFLQLDRITGSPMSPAKPDKPPVLIQHGMTGSALDWVLTGPGRSLPLLLADAGYDVWLGNNRGSTLSRQHAWVSPNDDTFWDYSFHEMGIFDLYAFINYILEETRYNKISYVGFSQGCTQFFVLTSLFPEVNDLIWVSLLLAPPAYMGNISQPLLQKYKDQLEMILSMAQPLGINEVGAHYNIYNKLAKYVCNQPYYLPICTFPLALGVGMNFLQVDTNLLPTMMLAYPASISIKGLWHYYQGIISDRFRQYDYGTENNMKRYGSSEPPDYDLTRITAPIALFYSLNDVFVSVENIERLSKELPNILLIHQVSDKLFTHLDFIIAREVEKILYVHVIDLINLHHGL